MGGVTPVLSAGRIEFRPTDEFPPGARHIAHANSMSEAERDRYLDALRAGWVELTVLAES